jgi:hypothetical protein
VAKDLQARDPRERRRVYHGSTYRLVLGGMLRRDDWTVTADGTVIAGPMPYAGALAALDAVSPDAAST